MLELLVISAAIAVLAFLFGPGIRASAERKRSSDNTEVIHSEWRDWGGDDFESDPEVTPEPAHGVVRIQAR